MTERVTLKCSCSSSWAATMGMQTATSCKPDLEWPRWAFQTHPEYPQPLQVLSGLTGAVVLLCASTLHRLPKPQQFRKGSLVQA